MRKITKGNHWTYNKNGQFHGLHIDCFMTMHVAQWKNHQTHGMRVHFVSENNQKQMIGKLEDIL